MSVNDTLKAAAKFFELSEFPNGKALLLKAATTSNKKPKPDTQAARLGARVKKCSSTVSGYASTTLCAVSRKMKFP